MTINQKRPEHITATDPSAISIMDAPMPYQVLNAQGECIAVNQTLLDVLGYARQDLIGKNFAKIIHPDRVDHFKRKFSNIRAIGEVYEDEFEMVKRGGGTILGKEGISEGTGLGLPTVYGIV